jgi:hypothetical protein
MTRFGFAATNVIYDELRKSVDASPEGSTVRCWKVAGQVESHLRVICYAKDRAMRFDFRCLDGGVRRVDLPSWRV